MVDPVERFEARSAAALLQDLKEGRGRVHHGVADLLDGRIRRGRQVGGDARAVELERVAVEVERGALGGEVVARAAGEADERERAVVGGQLHALVRNLVVEQRYEFELVAELSVVHEEEAARHALHDVVV